MKTMTPCIVAMLILSAACNSATDSKVQAREENKSIAESSNIEEDVGFAVDAADGGLLEVQLGKLALQQASSAQVKEFGERMVEDHQQANEELKSLASAKNVTLPVNLSEESQRVYERLSKMEGVRFDEAYMDFMVRDHRQDIDAFQKQVDEGNDHSLTGWAKEKLPVLRHHLQMAESIQQMVAAAER